MTARGPIPKPSPAFAAFKKGLLADLSPSVEQTYPVKANQPLRDGVHYAGYIGRFDVPPSEFAFQLRNQQLRYLTVTPKRPVAVVRPIEIVKGADRSASVVRAVTFDPPE